MTRMDVLKLVVLASAFLIKKKNKKKDKTILSTYHGQKGFLNSTPPCTLDPS
jgi:hypothetical protein